MTHLPKLDAFTVKRSDFPDDFQFGTSTSAYQIEGSDFGGCGPCHWDTFSASPGNVVNYENGSLACDHYHRWEDDLDLMKASGFDAYRFSSSWARVMPDGKTINDEGLDFYDKLVDGLLARDIDPNLTLYHWELPSALADIGGWRNPDITDHFAHYAEVMIKRLGDRLSTVATFNEPWCVTWLSHYLGMHAPGMRDIRAASRSLHLVTIAHAKAMAAMRALGQGNLGAVLNFEHTSPLTDSEADAKAASLYEGIYNRWFLGAFTKGEYPADVLEHVEPYLPDGWQKDMVQLNQPLDWLGINYYTRRLVGAGETKPGSALPELTSELGDLPTTEMGWEVYPEGLGDILTWISKEYTGDIPLAVTENGLANKDVLIEGAVNDPERIAFLDAHFQQALKVVKSGVPLKAYFVWSMMDNFEWALGYDKRFGMVWVDFETMERTPKASLKALTEALAK